MFASTGLASGICIAAAMLFGSCQSAIAAPTAVSAAGWLVPFDGTGRYTLEQDNGQRSMQGLTELKSRFGVKPYNTLQSIPYDGTWQTERVFFRDVDSGATIVRLTSDPWANQLSYFKENWSADGKYIVFRRKPGIWEGSTDTHGPMVVKSDGTRLRNVFRDYPMVRSHACSPTEPDICYAMADENKLVAFDLKTGKTHHVVCEVKSYWHLKISPDGKYLMGRYLQTGDRCLWIVRSDGKEYHEISVPESIHDSYQFHPSQKKIMFWYEDRYRTEGFVQCDYDGQNMTKVPVQFDWNHGNVGPDRGVHASGDITQIKENTWSPLEPLFHAPGVEYYDNPTNTNGYLTWAPKDELWVYGTRIVALPYLSEIQSFHAEPVPGDVVNRFRICYTGLKRAGWTLDCPDASPDGTKVLFNSNMLDRVDAYYVVVRLPQSPRNLSAARTAGGTQLTWDPPLRHVETAGYRIFRSKQSGVGFVPIDSQLVVGQTYLDPSTPTDGTTFYAVWAVEHSGLESDLGQEAAVGSPPSANHLFVEAESGKCSPLMWAGFDGLASNLHYLWMRGRTGEGSVDMTVNLPQTAGPCEVWGRVKGEASAKFTLSHGDQSITLDAPGGNKWTWAKFSGELNLPRGAVELALKSSTYGSAVDCLAISDDRGFAPETSPRIAWPKLPIIQQCKAQATSPYTAQLSWQAEKSPAFHHYNLYCGHASDFVASQSSLIASPDQNRFCDWALNPGQTVYYRVTAVDCAGNESAPTSPAKLETPKIQRIIVDLDPADKIDFEVPKAGEYVLWLKLKNGGSGGQYINVQLDGKAGATWTCAFDGLSEKSWFTYDQWGRFPLSAGSHTLTIKNDTKHAIEQVFFTNDSSQKPAGHVNILSGW